MKPRTLILLFALISTTIMLPMRVVAQTDKELLLKLSNKIDKVVEQQATTSAKIDAMQKQMDVRFEAADKRIDILLYVMLGLLAGIFVLIGMVFWDKMTFAKPFEKVAEVIKEENKELKGPNNYSGRETTQTRVYV